MDGPRDDHTKWSSQTEKDKYKIYDVTYTWNLKYDMNELIYRTEIDSQTNCCLSIGFFISGCAVAAQWYISWVPDYHHNVSHTNFFDFLAHIKVMYTIL